MNPSFEAFVDPPDGFYDKPGTPSKSEGQFSPPEALVWRVNPECNFLLLRRPLKKPIFALGVEKRRFFGAPKKTNAAE